LSARIFWWVFLAEGMCDRLEAPVADDAGVSEWKGSEVVDDKDKGARNGRGTGRVLDVSGLMCLDLSL